MSEHTFNVTFTIEASDEQQASNVLHSALMRAAFADEIDWQVTFRAESTHPDDTRCLARLNQTGLRCVLHDSHVERGTDHKAHQLTGGCIAWTEGEPK